MLSLGILFRLLGEEGVTPYFNVRWVACLIRAGGKGGRAHICDMHSQIVEVEMSVVASR